MRRTDLLCLVMVSNSRWDQVLSSASISLAREFARTQRVFFIEQPFTIKDIITGRRNPWVRERITAALLGRSIYRYAEVGNKNLIVVTPLVTLSINWMPAGCLYNLFARINNWIFLRTVKRIVREHKLREFIFINSYNPFFAFSLPCSIKPLLYVYQSRDNIRESEYVYKHGPALERLTLQKANLRLATSRDLVEKLSTPQYPVNLFPNAADVELFTKAAENFIDVPAGLEKVQKPVIGYIGNICHRIDYDLVYKIATGFPSWTLLMVGPRNDAGLHPYDFSTLKNVIFTGPQKFKDLPRYLKCIDCAILPFKVNALTKSIYPLKINEYLAGGKPVVSTAFSPDVESFRGLISLTNNHDVFLESIRNAVINDCETGRARRMEAARVNSWTARVTQFWELASHHI